MYSQFGEDEFIAKYFRARRGRVLDIGAWQPKKGSNTRWLIELGWGGVLVEPSPKPLEGLITEYAPLSDRVSVLGAAVGIQSGIACFWDTGGTELATLDDRMRDQWRASHGAKYRPFWTPVVTVPEIVSVFPGPYECVSIDAEGFSAQIFLGFDWSTVGTQLAVIEHDGRVDDIVAHAQKFGMTKKLQTFANVVVGK